MLSITNFMSKSLKTTPSGKKLSIYEFLFPHGKRTAAAERGSIPDLY
jgi:hypothetical protein